MSKIGNVIIEVEEISRQTGYSADFLWEVLDESFEDWDGEQAYAECLADVRASAFEHDF